MKDQIYALYYEYADERQYFYVGRSNDPARRHNEHKYNVKNKNHTEDVYVFIRDKLQPNGIDVWEMEILVSEPNARPEDCEDFWVVKLIRDKHKLMNMKHGDLRRINLERLAKERGEFQTVNEFVEFRERVDREKYERSIRLRNSILDENAGNHQLLELVRQNAEAFRVKNEANVQRRLKKEARAHANAIEKQRWLEGINAMRQKEQDREELFAVMKNLVELNNGILSETDAAVLEDAQQLWRQLGREIDAIRKQIGCRDEK